ncbi:HlyD family type I secretion periplasmic adaptor subunit [Sulfitobacter sp. R18_1]|uniref:HlyD family type I secretion periplasmic adaptor subunit n=1 Tax=Sulfitobacter sp. R18_1 TaxID=2821104 RepID=UPI001ADA593A|nr:HlyD family type I secretion periplasmic adaptor subunit [Sulfitobacter sp. R18_1]MBO9427912.1 HlyD family type I secretion periplasmic adaptor subunit [Sulfitobacter sp. R18_1]
MQKYGQRKLILTGVFLLAALVAVMGGWAGTAQISGAIIAPGRVQVDDNRVIVQHLDGGVIETLHVDEGDLVEQGQLLLTLDPAELRSQYNIIESKLNEITARRARLEAERDNMNTLSFDPMLELKADRQEVKELMDGQQRLFEARNVSLKTEREQLGRRQKQIEEQIIGIEAQQDAMSEQLELLKGELDNQQTLLDRGLAQSSRVTSLRREQSRLRGSLGELQASKAQASGRIIELGIEIEKLDTSRRERAVTELRDQQYRELELLEQERVLRMQLGRQHVTAPVNGVVYNMAPVNPGAVLRPADPLLYLVPQNRPMVVAAEIEAKDIHRIAFNQEVLVRFSSLDQKNAPEVTGSVIKISADAFQVENRAPFYKVEIELSPEQLAEAIKNVDLIPGMPVEAFIQTGARTPLAYLTEPLTDYFMAAFREG